MKNYFENNHKGGIIYEKPFFFSFIKYFEKRL